MPKAGQLCKAISAPELPVRSAEAFVVTALLLTSFCLPHRTSCRHSQVWSQWHTTVDVLHANLRLSLFFQGSLSKAAIAKNGLRKQILKWDFGAGSPTGRLAMEDPVTGGTWSTDHHRQAVAIVEAFTRA